MKPGPPPAARLATTANAEERLRQVLENASVGILVAQDGRFRYANPAALAITGYDAAETKGAEFIPLVHAEDRARVIDHHVRRLRGEAVEPRYEFRVLTKAGETKWVQLSAVMIEWDGERATLSFISDVTERKTAELALAGSEARFRDFANASSDWFWETDAENRYTWFSGALERAVARPPSHYLGRTRTEVAIAAGVDVAAEPWKSHLETLARREPFRNLLQRRETPAGEVWMSVSGVPRFDAAGGFLGYRGAVTNVTALLESERRALASESRYRSVIEGAPIGVVIVQDNRLRYVNPQFARMVGATPQDLLSRRSILDRVHPDDRERMTALARDAVSRPTGDTLNVTYRILRDDGSTLSMDVSSVQVEWEGRRATLGFVQDIGERLRLEDELKRSLAERELILENSVVGIVFLTPDGRLKWANQAMGQIFGAPLAARYGQSLEASYATRESYIATGTAVAGAVLAGKAYETELQMRRDDGTLFWVLLSGKAINARDLSQGTVWVVRDIDRRKRLEEQLQRSNSEREAILQSALVGITFSVERRHRWVNRRLAAMLGCEPDELIGEPLQAHFPDDGDGRRFGEIADLAFTTGRPFSTEWQVRRRDGRLFWAELHGAAVDPGDPVKGVIWTFVDISARKQAEEDIRAALDKQRELNELKSRFVSMTSHEFRTPLATILSSSQLLRRYGGRLPENERGELYDSIETAVKRMTAMLEGILFIGKAESERLQFSPAPVRLAATCERLVADARAAAEASARQGVRHDVALDASGADEEVNLDAVLLRHILDNLLANAVKYSPDGGTVTLSVRAVNGRARFTVSDAGIGMPEEDLPNLYEAFYRAGNVGAISGTGLGLAIVRRCVDLHGGAIEVESELGKGTRFTVTLPCA